MRWVYGGSKKVDGMEILTDRLGKDSVYATAMRLSFFASPKSYANTWEIDELTPQLAAFFAAMGTLSFQVKLARFQGKPNNTDPWAVVTDEKETPTQTKEMVKSYKNWLTNVQRVMAKKPHWLKELSDYCTAKNVATHMGIVGDGFILLPDTP